MQLRTSSVEEKRRLWPAVTSSVTVDFTGNVSSSGCSLSQARVHHSGVFSVLAPIARKGCTPGFERLSVKDEPITPFILFFLWIEKSVC